MSISFEEFRLDLLEIAEKLGKTPTIEEYERYGNYSSNSIYYHEWGGWKTILEKANLLPGPRRYKDQIISDDLHDGMCKSHKNIKAQVNQLCLDCWFKQETYNNTGSSDNWQEIKQLFYTQNCECIYTGWKLIPGENASLDHKIPKSRGGISKLENLQWVDCDVNQIKYNRTHEEFLDFIKSIKINKLKGK
jgi:hypothetical protein